VRFEENFLYERKKSGEYQTFKKRKKNKYKVVSDSIIIEKNEKINNLGGKKFLLIK
jgi:hypothetical protein